MPPKASTSKGPTSKTRVEDSGSASEDPFSSSPEQPTRTTARSGRQRSDRTGDSFIDVAEEDDSEAPEKNIPADLLTRILHEFFAKDATRISKGANEAVGKYVDVFVREAIARAAVEKKGGFFEVEDLEKVTPQLLLDL